MSLEIDIKTILRKDCSPERKVEEITKFMTWNKEKLLKIIKEIGTDTDKQNSKIINYLWASKKRK